MRINPAQNRIKPTRPRITHEQMRANCRRWIDKMFLPIEPHQRSVMALINKVVDRTGLAPRRIEKLWRGYIPKPHAQEHETIRAAFLQWKEDWKAAGFQIHDENEAEHEGHLRAAVDYSAARWERASGAGQRDREPGAPAPAATNDG